MLVLSRRLNEKILFPTLRASVQVIAIRPGVVRLGVEAPPQVTVLREEVYTRTAQWGEPEKPAVSPAATPDLEKLHGFLGNRLRVTGVGLGLLRRQLLAGQTEEAAVTLDKIEEDVQLLRQRLQGQAEARLPRPHERPGQPCKALLVEDDYNERELLAGFLRMAGLEVETAGDGSDALDSLKARGRPDVVLLDMGLPRCDGATTVRAIRRNPALAGLKVFAVSGSLPEDFDVDLGPSGIDRWFHKPINPVDLLQDLNRELHRSPTSV